MAVPSSGQLREYADIGVELGVAQSNVSLRGMSAIAGFSTPDAMSEFYGYSGCTTDTLQIFGDGSCICAYKLDGNAYDLSGNYNGSVSNVVWGGSGQFGTSALFNGNAGISIGTPLASNIYTYSVWVKPTSPTTPGIGVIIGSASPDVQYYQQQDKILGYNGSGYMPAVPNVFLDTSWVHIVIISTGTNILFYRNAALLDNKVSASANSQSIILGKHPRFSLEYFSGSLDQVRIFNKALSAAEVTTLYNETSCN